MIIPQELFPFRRVGRWSLDQSLGSGIRFELFDWSDRRVIYAFSTSDRILYIGVCDSSTTTLGSRMSRYQSKAGAGANERIAARIRDTLAQGSEVDINAWNPEEGVTIHGIQVDLVKGLENPLIRALSPDWNIHG